MVPPPPQPFGLSDANKPKLNPTFQNFWYYQDLCSDQLLQLYCFQLASVILEQLHFLLKEAAYCNLPSYHVQTNNKFRFKRKKINLLAITLGPLSSTFLSLKIVVWWEKSLMESKKHEHKGQGKRKTSVCKLLSHTIHHLSSNEWLLNEYWTWTNHHISVQSKKMTHRSPQTIFSFDLSLFANNRGSGKVSYTLFYTTIWKDFELSLTLLSIVFERKLWWRTNFLLFQFHLRSEWLLRCFYPLVNHTNRSRVKNCSHVTARDDDELPWANTSPDLRVDVGSKPPPRTSLPELLIDEGVVMKSKSFSVKNKNNPKVSMYIGITRTECCLLLN